MSVAQIVLILLIFFVIAGFGVLYIMAQENQRKKHKLSVIAGHNDSTKKSHDKDEQNKRRAEIAKKLKDTKDEERFAEKGKKKQTIAMSLEQAGLSISVKQFWIFSVLLMVLAVVLAKMMGQPPVVIIFIAITALLGIPKLVVKKIIARRQKKFLEEFPDALEATVRLLKAGMPVSEAVHMISKEFTGPVGEEMSRIYDKQKIGVSLPEAALEATRRMPIPEMQMFATGLAIQAQTGSSLSEVLMNLSGVIRARFRLKRKVKALSSEAIASASIIGALPNLVALGMYFTNRDYIMILFTTSTGKVLLIGAVVWMMIGVFMMKAMINFKV